MKVCMVLHDLRGGGAEKISVRLAGGMARAGADVELVLVRAIGEYMDEIPEGVRVVDLKGARVVTSVPAIADHIRSSRPTAVLSAMTHVNVATIAARKLSGARSKLFVAEHNQVSKKLAAAKFARKAPYMAARAFYPHADGVIAVSEGVANDVADTLRCPREKVHVVYNPVVDDNLQVLAAQAPEHPWFEDGGPAPFLAVGRLTEQKGFSTLLSAFARVRAQRPARLVILGEGHLRAALESQAADLGVAQDVAMPGFVKNPYACMSRARAFVLSSYWEGLPTVLIEALACGAPVVSTDCPSGPREILQDGAVGHLVPVGGVEDLAAAMLAVDPAQTAARRGRTRAQDFSVERAVEGYLELFGS